MLSRFTHLLLHTTSRLNRPRAACLVAVLIALPTLLGGFFFDDYVHLLTLRGEGFGAGPLDLFLFATGDTDGMAQHIATGPFPWYTWPTLKLHFFRPLSSATMMLDFHVFGGHAMLYHLHSIAWYGLLGWGVFLIYRRLFALPIAGLCILLYLLDDGHLLPVLWWSNRNALVSAAPAVLGLAAHLRWREEGWRPGMPLSLLGYCLGLLGGETALGILGYVAAYELVTSRPWHARVRGLAPAALLASVYLLGYKWSGHGVGGSGVYFDPVGEWPLFLSLAPGRMLDLVGAQFFGLPVELSVFAPGLILPIHGAALLCLGLLLLAMRSLWRVFAPEERRNLCWLLPGAALATVPALATFPSGRLLILPSLGACALIGLVIYHGLTALVRHPLFTRSMAGFFVMVHVALAPLAWVGASVAVPLLTRFSEDAFHEVALDNDKVSGQRVFCLFAADPYTGFYPVVMRRYLDYPSPLGWQVFSMAPFDHEVKRTGEKQFELRVLDGEMLSTPFERLMRSHAHPLKSGDTVVCEGFRVTVLEAGSWGPRRIALDFDRPLEDGGYAFLAWQGGRLSTFDWPAIGESTRLRVDEGYFAWKYFRKRLSLL
jgi:hypothetical protein